MRNIPKQYKLNNYSLLFIELIKETEQKIKLFENSALFQYYLKIKNAEKLNLMIVNYSSQIRNLEKQKCIEFLYDKIRLPIKLKIEKDEKGIISNIEYQKGSNEQNSKEIRGSNIIDYLSNKNQPIKYFINEFPNFRLYEDEFDDILEIEEKANVPQCINSFFNELKEIINNQDLQKTQLDLNRQNQMQNLSLYNTVMGQRNYINQINDNNITNQSIYNYGNVNHTNLINNEEIQESWGGNGMDYKNNLNMNYNYNYNYNNNITNTNNTNSSYIDPKEAGQKKTLNEYKKLLNKIDEKLDMP
jgi:hypothetical protein